MEMHPLFAEKYIEGQYHVADLMQSEFQIHCLNRTGGFLDIAYELMSWCVRE